MIRSFHALMTLLLAFAAAPLAADVAGSPGERSAELVLVAGATGRTGREVVRELSEQGYRVRALVRDEDAARGILGAPDETLAFVRGDVRDRAEMDEAVAGADYVISAIGSTRKDEGSGPEFVDYGGIRNLAEAAAAAGVKQFVLISSAGVTQEDHILNKMFDNVLVWKAKGEQSLRDSGVPYTIVRPGGLVDKPGGQAVVFQQGDTGTGMVPRADVARVCVAALKHPEAKNRTFELFGADGLASTQWAELFGALKPDPESP